MVIYPLDRNLLKYEQFSEEEEVECFKKVKEGDEKAREQAILHNIKFAIWAASQWGEMYYTIDDALNTAITGLIIAIDKFDIDKGIKFCTYARYWVYRALKRGKSKINLRELSFNICDDTEAETIQDILLNSINDDDNDKIIDNISLHDIWNKLSKLLNKNEFALICARYKNENIVSYTKLANTKNLGIIKRKTTKQRLHQRETELFNKLRNNKKLIKLWQEYCNN